MDDDGVYKTKKTTIIIKKKFKFFYIAIKYSVNECEFFSKNGSIKQNAGFYATIKCARITNTWKQASIWLLFRRVVAVF